MKALSDNNQKPKTKTKTYKNNHKQLYVYLKTMCEYLSTMRIIFQR